MDNKSNGAGLAAGAAAFVMWGLLPVYWKALKQVPSLEILCHRLVWSLVFAALVLLVQKRWKEVLEPFSSGRSLGLMVLGGVLIGANWLTYIYAVNNGHVVEASLGYYINPLVNVLLGGLFLGDRLRRLQIPAILLAATGVSIMVVKFGRPPWIALILAFSFGLYGLTRKLERVESLPGLFCETLVLSPLALGYLFHLSRIGQSAFLNQNLNTDLLLAGAGAVTSIPLLCFAFAARRLTLTTIGLLQYIGPTGMFLLGVFAYNEPFTQTHLMTFGCIWLGVALYTLEGWLNLKKVKGASGGRGE